MNNELERRKLGAPPRESHLRKALIAAVAATVVVAGLFVILANRNSGLPTSSFPIRASGLPASISNPLANLMSLSPVPRTHAHAFTLTDQRGRTISLASFRGRTVVLEFMDSHCTDICPIVSQELIDAYKDLGSTASHVVFLAVNVNRFHTSVTDMRTFTDEHFLNSIPSWHFMTGPPSLLKAIWSDYGVTVVAPSPTADVVHSSLIFFINRNGQEQYLANPTDLHTASGSSYLPAGSLADWGKGIALVVKSMMK
jgi:cytochrome oxidase Cu insertion factor (SCO1/SenC/PrrC family)